METKSFKMNFKAIDEEGHFEAYISTKNIDSQNDIVLPTAFKRTVEHHKGVFPILWMHNGNTPIGASTEIIIEDKGVRARGRINLDTKLGREVYSGMKFSPPYIDRTSIGFQTVDSDYDRKTNIRTIKELKLMEFSLITRNMASNSEALVQSVKSTEVFSKLEERLANLERVVTMEYKERMGYEMMADEMSDEEYIDEESDEDEYLSEGELIEEAMEMLDDLHTKLGVIKQRIEGKVCKPKRMTEDMEEDEMEDGMGDSQKALAHMVESLESTLSFSKKMAIGDMSLPLAPRQKEWNGPAAQKRIFEWAGGMDFDPAKAKKAFFYVDAAKPKERGSYKLPFADVINGKLVAVPRAIFAVEAALNGARGGVDIPASDKSKIMKKVMAYRKRINSKEPKSDMSSLLREMKNFARSVK